MSLNSTLYFTAVEEMLQDMLQLEDAQSENQPQSEIEPYTHTPKRTVRIRQHIVICRRSPKPLPNCAQTHIPERDLSPQTRKDFQGLQLLRLRREKSEGNQKDNPHRRLTIRI